MNLLNEQKLEAAFTALLPRVDANQKMFAASEGKYRCLKSVAVGIDLPGTLTQTVDEYVSPSGAGYVLALEYVKDGEVWRRVFQHGPEAWRASGWRNVTHLKEKAKEQKSWR